MVVVAARSAYGNEVPAEVRFSPGPLTTDANSAQAGDDGLVLALRTLFSARTTARGLELGIGDGVLVHIAIALCRAVWCAFRVVEALPHGALTFLTDGLISRRLRGDEYIRLRTGHSHIAAFQPLQFEEDIEGSHNRITQRSPQS